MKKILAILLSLLTLPNCSKEKDKSIFESLSIATLRKDRVTLTGSAVKGLIKNADIKIHPVLSDGTCNTKTVLGSAISDQAGEYSVFFNRGSGFVCIQVKANADGSTRMFNEKLNQDISVLPNSDFNLTSIVTEDKISGNSKGNNLVSPFSKFAARRLANLMSNSGNSANLSTLNRKASKEVVIRFGLNAGLSAANARTETLTRNTKPAFVLDVNYPEMDDIDIQLGNLNNPLSVKYITVLAGFSYLANQFKRGTVSTADDVNSVIDSFAKDFEDGVFDGKDSTGKVVTIGTGSNQRDLPVDSITNLLLPAINSFIQEGGRIGVGENSISLPLTSLSQVQFLDSVSILSVTPGTGTGTATGTPPVATFTIGGTVTDLYTAGLVLQNNTGEEIPVTHSVGASRTFTFNTKVSTYAVTVKTQPIATTCSVINGTGTATADITNVSVSCLTYVGNGVLKSLNNLTNSSTVFAGESAPTMTGGATNGIGTIARFNTPIGITTDGTNFYVTEGGAQRIRKIVIATGEVSNLATGLTSNPTGITILGPNLYVSGYGDRQIYSVPIATGIPTSIAGVNTAAFADGVGPVARFWNPEGLTTDGTDLYLADQGNWRIRKIVIATAEVTTLAGGGVSTFTDGIGGSARFTNPTGITSDGTNLYVSDAHRIRKVVIATGLVSTIAGSTPGYVDAPGLSAQFGSSVHGILTDGTNLFIGATDHHTIRKIVISTGVVTTLAGVQGGNTDLDGIGTVARFNTPRHLTSDGTSLYVALLSGNKIRRLQ